MRCGKLLMYSLLSTGLPERRPGTIKGNIRCGSHQEFMVLRPWAKWVILQPARDSGSLGAYHTDVGISVSDVLVPSEVLPGCWCLVSSPGP